MSRFSLSALQVLSLMVFWGQIQNYMMRQNVAIVIVAMVKDDDDGGNSTEMTVKESCGDVGGGQKQVIQPVGDDDGEGTAKREGDFDWDSFTRGLILSAFGYGYVTTQIVGGRLAERRGVRAVYGRCLAACGVLTLLSPAAARYGGAWAFGALRVLQGVFEGVTFPSLHAMTARWVPPDERSSFIARSYFGSTFGLIITFPLCGYVAREVSWDAAFYVVGAITAVWYIAWLLLVYDSPEEHPRISQEEKSRILDALDSSTSVEVPVPWKSILTSPPMYGLLITDICNCWGLYTMATNGPSYLKFMLGLDVAATGVLSALPMLSRYIGGVLLAAGADFLLRRRYLSRTNVRRIFNSISQCAPAIAMGLLAFSGN